jgi:predicted aspartyl protease
VLGSHGQSQVIDAVIDTVFAGSLSLPPSVISSLELPWRRRGIAILADGRETVCDVFQATILWDGNPRLVAVDAVEMTALVGMSLLFGCELTMQVVERGIVTIRLLV